MAASLAKKLGAQPDLRVLAVGPIPAAVLGELFDPDLEAIEPSYDVIVACCPDRAALDQAVGTWPDRLAVGGGLWLCWIKRASGVPTDIGEADVRAAGLETGLVDNKIAAVDDTWSGLRFVRRSRSANLSGAQPPIDP